MFLVWHLNLEENMTLIESSFPYAMSMLCKVEQDSINRFRSKKNKFQSLAGQIMARSVFAETQKYPFKSINFYRTEKGRPYAFLENHMKMPDYNVSHHGDYVSLIYTDLDYKVGIDITRIEKFASESFKDFVEPFTDKLSDDEMKWLNQSSSEDDKLAKFYSLWALKESVLKALGIGITDETFPFPSFKFESLTETNEPLSSIKAFI